MAKLKGVTVADLPDLLGSRGPYPFLLCTECFEQSSGHAGDYWDWPADRVFTHCGKPMRLVTKVVRFVDWRKPKEPKRRARYARVP